MATDENYAPSPTGWVREAVERIEATGSTEPAGFRGFQVVMLTMRGAKTGNLRKVPLMRVEHDGRYAAVASLGGAPKHPVWYYNLQADPRITVQDGTETGSFVARELDGNERGEWWDRAVAAYPDYADYQAKTDRRIPVFVLEPAAC